MMIFGARTALAFSVGCGIFVYIMVLPFANIKQNPRVYTPNEYRIEVGLLLIGISAAVWGLAVLADLAFKWCAGVTRPYFSRPSRAINSMQSDARNWPAVENLIQVL